MKRTIHLIVCMMLCTVPFFCFTEGVAQKIGYVEPRQWAVVYASVPTPLEVHADTKPENVTLSVSTGRVEKGENNTYYLYMPDSMQGKTVTVSILNKKSGKEIGFSKFRIYKVPDPTPFLGMIIRDGFRTPNEILFCPKIRATNSGDFIYGIKWEVISFRINIISNGVSVVDRICLGDSIPQDIQKIIKTVPTNSSVTFRNIVVSSSAGARMLPEFTVFIKEEDDVIEDPFDDTIDDPDFAFEDEEPAVLFSEVEPQFPGGIDAMNEYLVKNIKVPEQAKNMGVNGTVFVEFVVEKNGSITEPRLKNSLHPLFDKEVLRVVGNMPKWRPGLNMGKPVRCRYIDSCGVAGGIRSSFVFLTKKINDKKNHRYCSSDAAPHRPFRANPAVPRGV